MCLVLVCNLRQTFEVFVRSSLLLYYISSAPSCRSPFLSFFRCLSFIYSSFLTCCHSAICLLLVTLPRITDGVLVTQSTAVWLFETQPMTVGLIDKSDGVKKRNVNDACVCLSCTLLMSHCVILHQDVPSEQEQWLMEKLNTS